MKISLTHRGKLNKMFGKHLSEDTKRKMSETHKKGKLCKAVKCIETGEIFISATEAGRSLNMSQTYISKAARGVCEKARGLHFCYVDKEVTH